MIRQDALAGQIGIRQLPVGDEYLHQRLAKRTQSVCSAARLHIQDGDIVVQDLVELRRNAAGRNARLGSDRVLHQAHIKADAGIVDKQLIGPADTGQTSILIDPHKIVGIEIIFTVDLFQFKDDGVIQLPAAHRGGRDAQDAGARSV